MSNENVHPIPLQRNPLLALTLYQTPFTKSMILHLITHKLFVCLLEGLWFVVLDLNVFTVCSGSKLTNKNAKVTQSKPAIVFYLEVKYAVISGLCAAVS